MSSASAARVMGGAEWALLLALSGLWGGSFFFAAVAVAAVPPLTLALLRVGIAAAALGAVGLARGRRPPAEPRPWAAFAVMGLLNNVVPFGLIFWAQQHVASGLAAILNATTPLWAVLLAHLLTSDERLRPNRLAGVLTGFAGVAVMVGPGALAGFGADLAPQAAVLLAAVSYACAGLFGRRFRGLPPATAAAGQLTGSTVLLLPVACALERPWSLPLPGLAVLAAVLALALLSTALAYTLYFRILRTAGATNLLLVTLLIPVSALLLGTVVLGEALEPGQLAGTALIGLGLLTIDGRALGLVRALAGRTPTPAARDQELRSPREKSL